MSTRLWWHVPVRPDPFEAGAAPPGTLVMCILPSWPVLVPFRPGSACLVITSGMNVLLAACLIVPLASGAAPAAARACGGHPLDFDADGRPDLAVAATRAGGGRSRS
jgi:hypothetical protein